MSFIYGLAKQKMMTPTALSENDAAQKLNGSIIRLLADDIRVALITTGHTALEATHNDFDDLVGNVIGNSGNTAMTDMPLLTGKTVSGKTFDATVDTVFTSVTGAQVIGLALFKEVAGSSATSPLLAYINGTGFPFTPNGGDVTIQWENSPTPRIFDL